MAEHEERRIAEGFHRAVGLADGARVHLRLLRPDDREAIAAGFERLSPRSRYRRFFSAMKRLPPSVLDNLVHTDNENHLAIVAYRADDDDKSGLGVARFIRSPDDSSVADAAVAVVDDWQGRGLGTLLLKTLIEAAHERGVRTFRCHVLADNGPMKAMLADLAPQIVGRREEDYLVYDLPLPGAEREPLREGVLYRVFRTAAQGMTTAFRALIGGDDNEHETEAD